MVFCKTTNIRYLWDKHLSLCPKITVNTKVVEQMVLRDINDIVSAMGKDIHTFGLPHLDDLSKKTLDIILL